MQFSWHSIDEIFRLQPGTLSAQMGGNEILCANRIAGRRHGTRACSPEGTPYEKAQFLALRDELAREWNPRNGIERNLLDQMATAYTHGSVLAEDHVPMDEFMIPKDVTSNTGQQGTDAAPVYF